MSRFAIRTSSRNPALWMAAGYGGYFTAVGCYFPFIALYYRHLGLSGAEIGLLTAMLPFATAVLAPGWGFIADRYGAHRLILRGALIFAAVAALAITRFTTFAPIAGLVALLALVAAPTLPFLDSFGITISQKQGLGYGRIRVWGSAGYIVASAVVGWLMGRSVSSLFLLTYAAALLLTAAATLGLPALHERPSQRTWRGSAAVLRRPAMLVLLLTTYLVSVSTTAIYNFLGIYLAELGGGATFVGAANALAAVSELPVLMFGATLAAWIGNRRLLLLAIAVYMLRYLAYSVAPGPAWILPIQLLHGLSFGANLMASVTLVNDIAGAELAATAQGLLASAFAFGSITGSLAGGVLLDRFGVVVIFRLAALCALAGLAIFILGSRVMVAAEASSRETVAGSQ